MTAPAMLPFSTNAFMRGEIFASRSASIPAFATSKLAANAVAPARNIRKKGRLMHCSLNSADVMAETTCEPVRIKVPDRLHVNLDDYMLCMPATEAIPAAGREGGSGVKPVDRKLQRRQFLGSS